MSKQQVEQKLAGSDCCNFETACSLEVLPRGESFVVDGVELGGEIGKRLADMGFTGGAKGRVVRKALLGDPIQVEIRGYQVSIRKSEARGVRIKRGVAE